MVELGVPKWGYADSEFAVARITGLDAQGAWFLEPVVPTGLPRGDLLHFSFSHPGYYQIVAPRGVTYWRYDGGRELRRVGRDDVMAAFGRAVTGGACSHDDAASEEVRGG